MDVLAVPDLEISEALDRDAYKLPQLSPKRVGMLQILKLSLLHLPTLMTLAFFEVVWQRTDPPQYE